MTALARHWDIIRKALADEKAHATSVIKVHETAFLPAALEIIERPVSPTARWTARILLLGLVLTIVWMTFGKIDVVASAPGRLIPADNVKLVQPAEAGIVRAILVRDGQRVRRGQPLVELDPTVSTAEAEQARKALETAELDSARLLAILSALEGRGLAFLPPEGTAQGVAQMHLALARSQLEEIEATALGQSANRQSALAARTEALIQADKLAETLPLLDQQIEANESLLAKGYVSKLKVIEMRRQRLSAARDRDIALETANRTGAQFTAAGSASIQSRAQARTQLLSQLATAQSDAKLRREELVKATRRSSLQRLTAPVNGTVTQLAIHTIGGVVEPAKPVMVIVPNGGRLVLEASILNKDSGFVSVGQEVAVKLQAFPFTRYGTVQGRVESISSDAVEDEKLGLIYRARITLDRNMPDRGGARITLGPGMVGTADIKTGKRSILSYFLSPIDETRLEAGRER